MILLWGVGITLKTTPPFSSDLDTQLPRSGDYEKFFFEVKLLMGRDERELFFVHSVLLDHFRVVLSDRFVFIHTFKH